MSELDNFCLDCSGTHARVAALTAEVMRIRTERDIAQDVCRKLRNGARMDGHRMAAIAEASDALRARVAELDRLLRDCRLAWRSGERPEDYDYIDAALAKGEGNG